MRHLWCLETQFSIKAARAGFGDTQVSQFPDTLRVSNCISLEEKRINEREFWTYPGPSFLLRKDKGGPHQGGPSFLNGKDKGAGMEICDSILPSPLKWPLPGREGNFHFYILNGLNFKKFIEVFKFE